MRFLVGLTLSILLTASLAGAFDCPGQNAVLRTKGFQALTVSNTAVGFTVPSGTEYAIASLEANNIRYRDDGTAPTSSVGLLITATSIFGVCQNSLDSIRFIRETADGLLNIEYYGR